MASSPEKENTIGEVPIEELPASMEKAASVSAATSRFFTANLRWTFRLAMNLSWIHLRTRLKREYSLPPSTPTLTNDKQGSQRDRG
jgi:hypothetical protein